MTTLIPILGDQLTPAISALDSIDRHDAVLLMMEVDEETRYVDHHRKKLVFILSAMRHHADRLRGLGWTVDYVALDDPDNAGSFTGEVARAVGRHAPDRIIVTESGEWRVQAMLDAWETLFGLSVEIRPDTRFLCSHREFAAWAGDRKQLRMEYFYREMRCKTALLMDGDKPEGGKWNYDKENRKPAKTDLFMPRPLSFRPDEITQDVIDLIEGRYTDNPGSLDGFDFAVTHNDAMRQQRHFLDHALANFGTYQDAMLTGEPHLWHSILSPYINAGLLDPLDLCREVDTRYRAGTVPLNSAEGFIRQIIGWREYVRGIYWLEGPDYVARNFLNAHRDLPAFYWSGDTDLFCLKEAIGQTLASAHAHHIQRLMVTGNFALLIGADPAQVHKWYLEIYADAYEWVELPNTLGMSQFGDGGLLGSKPYGASGAYINRMSDYCQHCRYDVNQRVGDDACPFNALYWDFLARNEAKLGDNPRLAMPYRTWARMDDDDKQAIRVSAQAFLARLDGAKGY